MARGIISRCPCGACRCISFTDDDDAVSRGWFHGDTELTFWEGNESPEAVECPECHAPLDISILKEHEAGLRLMEENLPEGIIDVDH
jgi:hypothetical protein